ncbi:MAG TPA: HAD-IIB family hydrolase [Gemmatimonadales bacterium]|nr:HAD-IIB family hydrolase [Gemmatimonadales bacterium]
MRILATDLDGTFLGGSAEGRAALTRYFRDDPGRTLLYVTGRSSRSVTALVRQGTLPEPDAMICDVGSYVAYPDGTPYAGPLLSDIAEQWGDRSAAVRAALADLAGLRLQEYFGPYRMSYYYDSPAVLDEAFRRAEGLGCDGLVSDGLYFDVLPRGVNKGSTLRRLMREWQVPDEVVLVAGDTLNDLAMITCGLPAVAVGNSEAGLLARLPPSDRIYRARAHGTDGILEALAHHGVEVPHV